MVAEGKASEDSYVPKSCSSKFFSDPGSYKGAKRMVFPIYSVKKVVTCSRSHSSKARTKPNIFQVPDCHQCSSPAICHDVSHSTIDRWGDKKMTGVGNQADMSMRPSFAALSLWVLLNFS